MLSTPAPAKVNLYLHVTGRREDGYHLLDSLVTFAGVGDQLTLEPASCFSFEMKGPMAVGLHTEDQSQNLVVRAARKLAEKMAQKLECKLVLTKNLPVASGIGGGSTDAAAALRLLAQYWGLPADHEELYNVAKELGQDVPCCIAAETCYFRGIGDVTDKGPALPHVDVVLVNPNKGLSTPSVFKARAGAFDPAVGPLPLCENAQALAQALALRTNGLAAAAIDLCPSISTILSEIAGLDSCLLSRMSGSGATCFGLFADRLSAKKAAASLYEKHPDWWVVDTFLPA